MGDIALHIKEVLPRRPARASSHQAIGRIHVRRHDVPAGVQLTDRVPLIVEVVPPLGGEEAALLLPGPQPISAVLELGRAGGKVRQPVLAVEGAGVARIGRRVAVAVISVAGSGALVGRVIASARVAKRRRIAGPVPGVGFGVAAKARAALLGQAVLGVVVLVQSGVIGKA